jgi:hypothetical protein
MGRRRSSLAIDGVGFLLIIEEGNGEKKQSSLKLHEIGDEERSRGVGCRRFGCGFGLLGRHWACRVMPARARFLASRAGHADVASSRGFGRGGAGARCRRSIAGVRGCASAGRRWGRA